MTRRFQASFQGLAFRKAKFGVRHRRLQFEALETRKLLSGSHGFLPAQVTKAYGIDQIPMVSGQLPGAGQTIALIEIADNTGFVNSTDPSFSTSDLAMFDQLTNLADPPSFMISSYDPDTGTADSRLPIEDGGTGGEFAMDVEWAHAIAPGASIIVIEVGASDRSSLAKTMQYAASLPGVSVVSASLGDAEFAGETNLDQYFLTPAGHQGVTFLASSGDGKTVYNPLYPALSPNIVAVGATKLTTDSNGNYESESAWNRSQGGTSEYEASPAYQSNVNTSGYRQSPDVAAVGSPESGVAVYNTLAHGPSGWAPTASTGSGTSLAAPIWAGLIAIADQLRANAGLGTLDGATQTLPRLYQLPARDFHPITSVESGSQATGDPRSTTNLSASYNLFGGLGSPVANLLAPDLAYISPYAITGINSPYVSDIGTLTGSGRLNTTVTTTTPNYSTSGTDWYDQGQYGDSVTGPEAQGLSWGPQSLLQSVPTLPSGVSQNTYYGQRVIAAAEALIGMPYQHHHDPLWNPYANGYSSDSSADNYWSWEAVSDNATSDLYIPTRQSNGTWTTVNATFPNPYYSGYDQGGAGIDCSNLAALAYNVGAGIFLNGDVGKQGVCDANANYSGTSPLGWSNSDTPVFIDPTVSTNADIQQITPQFIVGPNSAYNATTNSRYITQMNAPGSLNSIISQLQPGDLLYIAGSPGSSSSVTHVVMWLGAYGTLADGSPSRVPLVLSSHDNTPAVLDADGQMPPPGVEILPFNTSSWFYTNFSHAMRLTFSSAAPTVATVAAATPSPVTGTTTALSVLGADAGGESNLTYTWATTGTPPAAVNFSVNGTNGAKNTTATFTKAGNYAFQVTIANVGGLTATSNINVTVNQTLTTIAVSPGTATLGQNETQQFTATAEDQFGDALSSSPTMTWTTTAGTIDTSGLLTAPGTLASNTTVTASSGSIGGTATFSVTGPTIGSVVVSSRGSMTWNVQDSNSVTSSSLSIDGNPVSGISGPSNAASGVNFTGEFGGLAAGAHTYTITATNSIGDSSRYVGTFSVTGPTIGHVAVTSSRGSMTWNVQDPSGVRSSSLAIDGNRVSRIVGPVRAVSGFSFSAVFGGLTTGPHTYTITATNSIGNSSRSIGTFGVTGPTISNVVVVSSGSLTWNVRSSNGVKSTSLVVDSKPVARVLGPFWTLSGVNFVGLFASLSAGTHSFTITASDSISNSSSYTGTFSVAGLSTDAAIRRVFLSSWSVYASVRPTLWQ